MKIAVQDFKEVHFSRDAVLLYMNRVFLQVAFGVIGIFLPIFFFLEFNQSLTTVALLYMTVYGGHLLLTPIAAKLIAPLGMRKMLIAGVPLAMLAMGSLLFWDSNPLLVWAIHVTLIVLYKALYWVPYHVDFTLFTDKKARGRQLSILLNITEIVLILTPLLGGFIIANYGFQHVFTISTLLFLAALPPLFFISNPKESYSLGFFETFKELFKKKSRPLLIGYAADGAQSTISAIVWPIFIFQLFNGEYLSVGIITAFTLAAIIILRFFIGDIIDKWSKQRMVTIGAGLYTTGWIIKTFVETAFQVFFVDTYHNIGKTVNRISFDANTYTQSADNGHYIDEFTSLKEISLLMGRIIMLTLVIVVVSFTSIQMTFIAAAVATLLMTVVNRLAVSR